MTVGEACGHQDIIRQVCLGGGKGNGRAALVDIEDYDPVSKHSWWIMEQHNSVGKIISGPYAQTEISLGGGRHRILYMHTLITGWSQVDHRNGNGLDNTRKNLREVTKAQNGQNSGPRGGSSAFKGVGWDRRTGRWYAQIRANGTRHWLGRFTDEISAAKAYDAAALKLHGEFAYLNFPDAET